MARSQVGRAARNQGGIFDVDSEGRGAGRGSRGCASHAGRSRAGVQRQAASRELVAVRMGPDDKVGAPTGPRPRWCSSAVKLVKQGKTATLGKLYASDIPFFGAAAWLLKIPGTPTGGPFGSNGLVFHDELVTAEIGQVGTQFDGPGHIGVRTLRATSSTAASARRPTSGPATWSWAWATSGSSSSPRRVRLPRRAARRHQAPGRQPAADPDVDRQPGHHHRRRRQGDGPGRRDRRDRRGRRVPLHRPRRSVEEQRMAVAVRRGAARKPFISGSLASGAAPASTSPSRRSS